MMEHVEDVENMNLMMFGRYRFLILMIIWSTFIIILFRFQQRLQAIIGAGYKRMALLFIIVTIVCYYFGRYDQSYHLTREKFVRKTFQ